MRWFTVLLVLIVRLLPAQQQAGLLGTWDDPELIGSNAFDNTYNEIWGMVVNGREYAVIGSTAGTHFIDVTDPLSPYEAAFVSGASSGGQIIHRDFHHKGDYLFAVCDEGEGSLQVIDCSGLPDTAFAAYDSDSLIRRAHNIFIDGDLLYAFATNNPWQGSYAMRVFDVSDPLRPAFIGQYNDFDGIRAGHVHDGYVRGAIAFLNCGGDGLAIVDFSDPYLPRTLGKLPSYTQQGYNHSGWLSDDGRYYYMADENHGLDLKVVDVQDACNPVVTATFSPAVSNPLPIPHNQIAACGYLYSSYYYDGLQVFDISDPGNPAPVLHYDTYPGPDEQSYKGAWGVFPLLPSGNILVSDMQSGLLIFAGPGDSCYQRQELTDLQAGCNGVVTGAGMQLSEPGTVLYPQPARKGQEVFMHLPEALTGGKAALVSADGSQSHAVNMRAEGPGRWALRLPGALSPGLYFLLLEGAVSSIRLVVVP